MASAYSSAVFSRSTKSSLVRAVATSAIFASVAPARIHWMR
jgi:hypothetical protein